MTARKVILDEPLDRYVDEQVRAGAWPDAESLIRAGVERLRDEDAAKQARFEALVKEGLDDLAAGRFETVDDIDAWMAERGTPDDV